MEAAIRWSPHSTRDNRRFLIIDVAGNRLRLCQIDDFEKSKVKYRQICIRDKLPNYTAFDWSKKDPSIVAIGSASGEAIVVTLDPDKPENDYVHSFSIRHQRKCNSIAFSSKNLLATGLDRVRNDVCLNIYDLNDSRFTSKDEPYRKLASSEAISSIKFFAGQPDTLVAGVSRQYVRIYDLRDSSTTGIAQFQTRQVHNIAIDPLDENYFLSAGTAGDPTVIVWDTRFVKQRGTSNDTANSGAVLEFKPVVDNSHSASIWSLRYSGTKRGTFGVLANTGEFRVIEMAQHSHQPAKTADTPFARTWASPYYTKASHHLRYPSHDKTNQQDEKGRVMAYDFMTTGNTLSGQCALALHSNREVEVLRVPPPVPRLNVSALEEIYKDRTCIARPSSPHGTIADDLSEVQNEVLGEKYGFNQDDRSILSASMDRMRLSNSQRNRPLLSATHPSHEIHEDLLNLGYPHVKLSLSDYLAVLQAPKRRVQEGYSLDCARNKAIVSNDPWLVDIWTLVDRMDAHASGDGMVGNGLDLMYLGVSSIWANELTMYDERLIDPDAKTSQEMFSDAVKEIVEGAEFPAFEGIKTEYPENRQLCLSLCGWSLDKLGVQKSCQTLADEGDIYKAIVLAVFQGYKDVALALLRSKLQQKKLPQDDIGLAAVISCASPSSGVSADQREACAWMADMTSDPYLKSLLVYFISGEWTTVVGMSQLSLNDRVAVALKYLSDSQLSHFLNIATAAVIREGDISGLLLTGFTTRALDLLQVHISKHPSRIQDAVLLLSRACPLYIQDARWTLWKDIYLSHMQTWRTFLERTRYTKEHNLRSVTREGRSVNKPTQPSLTIRCLNCQQNLALRKDPRSAKQRLIPTPNQPSKPTIGPQKQRQASSPALACPNCATQMPRCGLCMLWLGSPDPAKQGAYDSLNGEDLEARLMVFCMSCSHGFHGHHARDWFARHAMCPVPDCGCMCGLLK
ncbi:WD40 repeat-like protein [Cucurbitaria berberidis CBS 394.84]|uniref:WD40 repeat-like protein n=1 Tax=Cucurbitaria berberidis CBS 394.84 TaxID=1168544 RepID=A0A9P4L5S5_9PLEO|nr:WD40 repeat-like protein [Cucurbitaria berberidis CBS 394.84]KAF1843005.1 WD40 repeat-like protein [Cucurbitaria berberidis CBS 394.84]